ncbi:MAG TPA: ornithine carbamoyltransferase, partial [Brevibacterium ravenspurgense]|nr:ornithine carbamoyltransferase [Brevibacterium ravenspurgense]
MTRHFLKDTDLTPAELSEVLDLAQRMKAEPYAFRPLEGPQTVAVVFDKTSTRTRVSFATGIAALGGNPLIINPGESQMGHKESIADSARVFSRMVSAIVWRTFDHAGLEEMAAHSSVPVINSLSDDYHPCQLLA